MVVKVKKPLAVIAAVVLTLLLAVSTAVPAFATESDMSSQSNAQFEIVDPKYEGDTNNYVTLPDAPTKDGYTFKGWSIDGSTELYSAGESIVNNDGHKLQLQPVYEAANKEPTKDYDKLTVSENDESELQYKAPSSNKALMCSICCLVIGIGLFVVGLILLLTYGKNVGWFIAFVGILFLIAALIICLQSFSLAANEELSSYYLALRAAKS